MDDSTSDTPYHSAELLDANNETEPLLAMLRTDIEKWLSENA
jgi:hypothetical protein